MGKILGLSSSPIPNSNTDRTVRAVLAATGLDTEFIKLSELSMSPCRGCLGCKDSNACVLRDDLTQLARKFRDASGFVLGAFTSYCSLDARAKMFMERMYCLRHRSGFNQGKVGAMVITTGGPPGHPAMPPAAEIAQQQISFWMMEEGMTNLGAITVKGNPPCIRCGYGDECTLSGIQMIYGPEASVASVGVSRFEDDPNQVAAAQIMGQQMRDSILVRAL